MPRHYDDDDDDEEYEDDDDYEENDDDDDDDGEGDDDLPDWYFDMDAMPESFWESFDDGDFEIEIFEIGIDYGEDT